MDPNFVFATRSSRAPRKVFVRMMLVHGSRLIVTTLFTILATAPLTCAVAQEVGALSASPSIVKGLAVGQQIQINLELRNRSLMPIDARAIPRGSALSYSTLTLRGFKGGCTVEPGPFSPLPSIFFEIRFSETQPGGSQICELTYQVSNPSPVDQQAIQYRLADINSSTIFSAREPGVTFGFGVFPVPGLPVAGVWVLSCLLVFIGVLKLIHQRVGQRVQPRARQPAE